MPTGNSKKPADTKKTDGFMRIPIAFNKHDTAIALALKHAIEKREKRTVTWAEVVRLSVRNLAQTEGIKC